MQTFDIVVYILIGCFLSYLSGSIPYGFIFSHFVTQEDITKKGSGNIGATNAARVGGKKLAIWTFIFDFLKGAGPTYAALHLAPIEVAAIVGFMAVIGHIFPMWLNFKGGKGVTTGLSVITVLEPYAGGIAAAVWIIIFLLKRISSLASLCMQIASITAVAFLSEMPVIAMQGVLTLLIVYKHKDNIKRLITGKEESFSKEPAVSKASS